MFMKILGEKGLLFEFGKPGGRGADLSRLVQTCADSEEWLLTNCELLICIFRATSGTALIETCLTSRPFSWEKLSSFRILDIEAVYFILVLALCACHRGVVFMCPAPPAGSKSYRIFIFWNSETLITALFVFIFRSLRGKYFIFFYFPPPMWVGLKSKKFMKSCSMIIWSTCEIKPNPLKES